ncbi:MAG: phage tail spike protein [[Clostridium] innocuum]
MLSVKTQDGWLPITVATNAYVEKDEEGEETLSFDVPPDSELFTYLKTEAEVRTEDNLYLIKGVNKLITQATITCELNMDDWKASYYLKTADIAALQTKTIGDVLNYIKPSGWTVTSEEVRTIKRTPDKEKCNGYDVLMRCKTVYDVQYDFDCLSKVVTVIDPYASADTGLYVTPELNMKDHTYKESSTELVTRLYCYGADDLTFADINNGKPYIDLQGYKGRPIVSSWTDGRYTNKESLLADGQKKLQELAAPVGSYTINMIDLAAVDDKYKDLQVKIRETAHCIIDPVRGIEIPHRIVKIRKYLLDEDKSNNTITLSNKPRDIKDMINQMQENVTELTQDGYKKETTIRNNSKSIELIAEKTDQNTKGIQKVEQQITPEQLLVTVSDSINKGNKLNTMQVIIDLLGLTIKNGGIKVYDGNNSLVLYVDQNTKKLNFSGTISGTTITGTLFDGGTIRTNDGNIGGWNIDSNGLYNGTVKIKNSGITNIYTWADVFMVRMIVSNIVTADADMISHYDFNGDGKITSADYVALKNRLKAM